MIKSPDLQILKYILIIFLGWRMVITLIAFFGLSLLPISLPENQIGWANTNTDFWLRWANWDGGHFRGIAENGYLTFQVVFFPLYPLLIKSLFFLKIPSLWGGLIISNLAIIAALFYLYKLVQLDSDSSISKKTIILILIFPTAFYFTAVYSESLFLFLTVAGFYYARVNKWLLAFLFASLAAATRLTGLVLILSLALEYFLKTSRPPEIKEFWGNFLNRIASYLLGVAIVLSFIQKFSWFSFSLLKIISKPLSIFLTIMSIILLSIFTLKFIFKNFNYQKILKKPTGFLLLSFIPFLLFCLFLYLSQDNFFAFIAHEKQWQRTFTFPWSAPINYFWELAGQGFFKLGQTQQKLIEFLFFILFTILLIFSYLKLRLSYTIYFALSLFIPVLTGTLEAIHRYGLVIFPIFILLALVKNETYYQLWVLLSVILLGFFTVLFINSYWVT